MSGKALFRTHTARWGLVLATFLPLPAYAFQGGNPSDPNSCYSDCGDSTIIPGVQNCFCDAACESKGDCCADKHEWCAPSTAKPVCSLVDAKKGANSQICGTDLGVSFVHNGRIEILFGDSMEYAAIGDTSCLDHGVDGRNMSPADYNDDIQARFAGGTARPAWVPAPITGSTTVFERTCADMTGGTSVLDFDRKTTTGANFTFQQLRLKKPPTTMDLPMGLLNTPLAAFSDGVSAFSMFVAPADDNPVSELSKHVYIGRRHGETTTLDRTRFDVIFDFGLAEGQGSASAPHTKFVNPSAARTFSLTNFDTPTGAADSELFIWGRGRFESTDSDSPTSNPMQLIRVHIPATGISTFTPSYFNGLDSSGNPLWTSTAPGVPVLTTDFRIVRQTDIKWIKEIKKWVMLYGGDSPDWGGPPMTMDQPRHGAIHMRTADFPWGPWSRPAPLLWREQMGRYYQCDAYDDTIPQGCDRKTFPPPTYPTGDWEPSITSFTGSSPFQDAQCQTTHPRPAASPNPNPISPFCPFLSQRGSMYSANMLPTWTRFVDGGPGATSTTTIYFAVSTWYPYDVVLAAADLLTPKITYPLQMQIRQVSSGKLIAGTGAIAPTFTTTAGGTGGGLSAFRIDKDVPADEKMKVGDTVVLHHVNDSNRLLAVVGSTLTYITNVSPAPSNAKWKVGSATLPNGSLVVLGSSSIRLSSVSSPTLFIKSSGTQPALGTADSSANWRFTYGCQSGDVCTR
jgi:hypothetical protein